MAQIFNLRKQDFTGESDIGFDFLAAGIEDAIVVVPGKATDVTTRAGGDRLTGKELRIESEGQLKTNAGQDELIFESIILGNDPNNQTPSQNDPFIDTGLNLGLGRDKLTAGTVTMYEAAFLRGGNGKDAIVIDKLIDAATEQVITEVGPGNSDNSNQGGNKEQVPVALEVGDLIIDGGNGKDSITIGDFSEAGEIVVDGGNGKDILFLEAGTYNVTVEDGTDLFLISNGADTLHVTNFEFVATIGSDTFLTFPPAEGTEFVLDPLTPPTAPV